MSQTNGISESPATFQGDVLVETTRPRQTEAPATPFRDVLAGGVSVLMGGAQIATSVLAGPALAAAVQDARVSATSAISPGSAGISSTTSALSVGTTPAAAVSGLSGTALAAAGAPTSGLASTTAGGAAVSDSSEIAQMQAMQRESQAFNLQLLSLQEDVQQENRRFTTLSNVLRAKHDTAKAAVSNIRS
ncbi:MAG TPA: hypothetical protein VHJ20_10795 [Polyangia bacterium]|nr:hypothetical protein [Polyangia bacterium]